MIDNHLVSGFVIVSEGVKNNFPFIESINSFLPVVDEIVVCFNVYGQKDGTREALEKLDRSKVRIVSAIYDIRNYGWLSHGISRSMGYQASRGDVAIMFDADDILHETDVVLLRKRISEMMKDKIGRAYFQRWQVYAKLTSWREMKHSGIYNKMILKDDFDFMEPKRRGAPNCDRLQTGQLESRQLDVTLFAYEHFWDTEDILRDKVIPYYKMLDRIMGKQEKEDETYYQNYVNEVVKRLSEIGQRVPIEIHPTIIRQKLEAVNQIHFGHSCFGRL